MKKPLLPLFLAMGAAIAPSGAATVANYAFTPTAGPTANPNSSDTDPNSTAGAFSIAGATASGGTTPQAGISTSTNMAFYRALSLTQTEAGALTNGDYFSFTVTPTSGVLDLASLSFDFGGSKGVTTSSDFTASTFLRTSVDGFSSTIGSTSQRTVSGANADNQLSNFSVPLSSNSSLQGLTGPVEFRLYLYNTDSLDTSILRIDNVILNTVPEPSLGLLGLAGAALLGGRRRRA